MENGTISVEGIDFCSNDMMVILLTKLTREDIDRIKQLCGDKFGGLYSDWADIYGVEIAEQWVSDRGVQSIEYEDLPDLSKHLIDRFIEFIER